MTRVPAQGLARIRAIPMGNIKAIETRYKGYRFRSRLEARWAVFFDALGLTWDYEPEGFETDAGWYLPDFFLQGNGTKGPYVEIKATLPSEIEISKLVSVCEDKSAYGLIISGTPSFKHTSWINIHKEWMRDGEERYNHLYLAYPFCDFETDEAVIAARSARFEHGEAP
jgi:hypothetical protein